MSRLREDRCHFGAQAAALCALCLLLAACADPPQPQIVIQTRDRWWLTGIRSEKDPAEERISRGFPQPVSSEHLQVINAGYYLVHKDAPGQIYYWFQLNVVKPFAGKVYTQSELENPEDPATPIRYTYYLNPGEQQTRAIHGPLHKVTLGHRYLLKLAVYEDPERTRLLEHLEQVIEAPFDNTSGCVELSEPARQALLNVIYPPEVCGSR